MTEVSEPDLPRSAVDANPDRQRRQLRLEALTMALYVAICLLAELAALSEDALHHGVVFVLVWGTTIGLAVAHLFAFLIAGGFAEGKRIGRQTRAIALAQLGGAAAVAVTVSAVLVFVPTSVELDAARYDLAAVIGVIGYLVARHAGVRPLRALLFAITVVIVGLGVAALKQRLGGH